VDRQVRCRATLATLWRVRAETALERLGGVAEAGVLERASSRGRVRVALARGRIIRDANGRYALPGADEALRAANRLSGVLCLDSAVRHHGWKLKQQPVRPSVAVPRNRKVDPERRRGVQVLYVDLAEQDAAGPATAPLRTVMDCAARLPFDEALTIADSALRAGAVSKAELLTAALAMPARYRARCLRVAAHADGRADNPFESVLRAIALDVPGLDLEPQVWLDDHRRADLVDESLGLVVEAESFEFHGRREHLKRDCERYNRFVLDGWMVVRFSWEHVMLRPSYVDFVLRSAVGALNTRPFRRALAGPETTVSA
jgi:very-short-patch-repair endonuclease